MKDKQEELVPVERAGGVTIYGRVIGPKGKLGRYEVHSDYLGHDGSVFMKYSDAKDKMNYLTGVKSK